jgi:phage regulator Rha-like protein
LDLTVPMELIRSKIYLLRGQKVLLDSDIAEMYGVQTGNLIKAVKRNIDRFPPDFMFQLASEETAALRFQIGISKAGRGGRRYAPYVFTEQGIAMLSSVLNSNQAVQVNIAIMRAFVQMRELAATNRGTAKRLDELEQKYDSQFKVVFDAIRQMMEPPVRKVRKIGFEKPQQ